MTHRGRLTTSNPRSCEGPAVHRTVRTQRPPQALTPQAFVAQIAAGRARYLDGFHIAFDNWHSTDASENHELAQDIYRGLRANGLIETRTIEQSVHADNGLLLPDPFI